MQLSRQIKPFLGAALLLPAIAVASDSSLFALPGALQDKAKRAFGLALQTNYTEAYATIQKIQEKDAGVACVIRGIVHLSEFDDTGDTLALFSSEKELSECSAKESWDILREFELGYARTAMGHSIKGALGTRKAAKKLEDVKDPDAQAFYAIYAYYVDEGLSFLPFVSDNREEYLKILEKGLEESEFFWALYATSLAWMYYDREEYGKALDVAERSLAKAPRNPVFLQMKADMLYKLGRFAEAAKIYEESASDYLKRTGKSVRYWCAIGNLARIYRDMGKDDKSLHNANLLKSPEYRKIEKWMPASLVNDLKKKKLYP